ncbi:MAG: HAD-IB family hydrolase [Gammaproteobacteria bacterium]|nr:HAD-IB family hydrolase [Gammaproteobacteria bacterium]
MSLALFDLDNTLLRGDSDYQWGQFLIAQGAVDAIQVARDHDRYYADYLAGRLDILAFLRFQLEPLTRFDQATLEDWRLRFLKEHIRPIITPSARQLVERHRRDGDTLVIITATNRFITEPIAAEFGIGELIATEPQQRDGRFTGEVEGVPCYREGKVTRMQAWLAEHGLAAEPALATSTFYSDSHNDLPLLERVGHPVAVNPDPPLERHALERGWPVLRLD